MKHNQYSNMNNWMPNRLAFRIYFAHLALIAGLCAPASVAQAADPPRVEVERPQVILWTFKAPTTPANTLAKLHAGLGEALPNKGARHLFGEKALQEYVGAKTAPPADCLIGLESCVSPQTLAFDALDLALVIHVELSRSGDQWVADCRWVDRRGEVAGRASLQAQTERDLAFELAGEIFNATASVSVTSEPAGARVEIDGDPVGTTPLNYRLSLGEHEYRLELDKYQTVSGSFTLVADSSERIDHQLQAQSGALVLLNTPPDAQIIVDGEPRGPANHRLELPEGSYEIEVRAPGYDTHRETLELTPGQSVQRRVQMDETHPLLRDVAADAIMQNRYIARLTYDHSFQSTTFEDYRASLGETRFSFLSFRQDGEARHDVRRLVSPNGLRLDFSYSWDNFGLVLLSASYLSTALDLEAYVSSSAVDDPIKVRIEKLQRLQLRPLQLRYRHFFKNVAVFAELGSGINMDWVRASGDLLDPPVTLSNSEAFWNLGLGASYYFTPNFFATLRYSAQSYIDDGPGSEHIISLGVGLTVPNILGFEPEPPETL